MCLLKLVAGVNKNVTLRLLRLERQSHRSTGERSRLQLMKRTSVETGVNDESKYEWRKELKSEVADSLRGVVDSYEILSETPDGVVGKLA